MERQEKPSRINCNYVVSNDIFQEMLFETAVYANGEKMPQSSKGIDLFTLPVFLRVQPESIVSLTTSKLNENQIKIFMDVMDQAHITNRISLLSKREAEEENFAITGKTEESDRRYRRNITQERLQELWGRYNYGPVQHFLISILPGAAPFPEDEPLNSGPQSPISEDEADAVQRYLASLGDEKNDRRRKRMLQAADTIEESCKTRFAEEVMLLHRLTQLKDEDRFEQTEKMLNNPNASKSLRRMLNLASTVTDKKLPEKILVRYVANQLKRRDLPSYGF